MRVCDVRTCKMLWIVFMCVGVGVVLQRLFGFGVEIEIEIGVGTKNAGWSRPSFTFSLHFPT